MEVSTSRSKTETAEERILKGAFGIGMAVVWQYFGLEVDA